MRLTHAQASRKSPFRHLAQRTLECLSKILLCNYACCVILCQGYSLTGGFTDILANIDNIMKIEDLEL